MRSPLRGVGTPAAHRNARPLVSDHATSELCAGVPLAGTGSRGDAWPGSPPNSAASGDVNESGLIIGGFVLLGVCIVVLALIWYSCR